MNYILYKNIYNENKENFIIIDDFEDIVFDSRNHKHILVENIIMLIFAICAGYLSWNCSGHYNIILRIVFALTASTFGLLYLFCYLIFKIGLCKKI